ncbi:hypothetical protein YC2023_084184 [Brassica napus]
MNPVCETWTAYSALIHQRPGITFYLYIITTFSKYLLKKLHKKFSFVRIKFLHRRHSNRDIWLYNLRFGNQIIRNKRATMTLANLIKTGTALSLVSFTKKRLKRSSVCSIAGSFRRFRLRYTSVCLTSIAGSDSGGSRSSRRSYPDFGSASRSSRWRQRLLTGFFPVLLIDVSPSIPLFISSSQAASSSGFFLSLKMTESQAGRSMVVGSIIVPLCAVLHRLSSVDDGVPSSLFLYRRWKVASSLLNACLKTPGAVTRGGMSKRLLQRDLS